MISYLKRGGRIVAVLIVLGASFVMAACGMVENSDTYSVSSGQESGNVENTSEGLTGQNILTDKGAEEDATESSVETAVDDGAEVVADGDKVVEGSEDKPNSEAGSETDSGAGSGAESGSESGSGSGAAAKPNSVKSASEKERSGSAAQAEGVEIMSNDGVTKMIFGADGTYTFVFDQYGVEDTGTYSYMGGVLTLIDANGEETTAEGDPIALHYEYSKSSELSGDFLIPTTELQ